MTPALNAITTDKAPKAIGPYSQAMAWSDIVFLSGQIPLDPATGELVVGDFGGQVERVMENLAAVLAAAGASFSTVLKVNVYLTDMAKFSQFNEVYSRYLTEHRPARAVVQVSALPRGAQVEIEAVAVRG
jgi:2-iminobutanoate/2-iminopropanoate deaminase